MKPANNRKSEILAAALALAIKHGYMHVTRLQISERIGCATGLVPYHFGTMCDLRRSVMSEALRTRCLPVLAQGIVAGHAKTKRMPDELRRAALESLMGA
jgi:AcrR family transcriptional regulator